MFFNFSKKLKTKIWSVWGDFGSATGYTFFSVACEQIQIQKLFLLLSYIYRYRISQATRVIIIQTNTVDINRFSNSHV